MDYSYKLSSPSPLKTKLEILCRRASRLVDYLLPRNLINRDSTMDYSYKLSSPSPLKTKLEILCRRASRLVDYLLPRNLINRDSTMDYSSPSPPVLPLKAGASLTREVALMVRPGIGTMGKKISLFSNHFKVSDPSSDEQFYCYSVQFSYEDGQEVGAKSLGRKIMDQVQQIYASVLDNKYFAYDGEKNFFTLGSLPQNNFEFTIVLENNVWSSTRTRGDGSLENEGKKRMKRQYQRKTIRVNISYAGKVSMQAIAHTLRGNQSEQIREALQVLDIILRQHAAKIGCLLVRQSFFNNNPSNLVELGGGILGCRGFYSSFKATQGGLTLNLDTSTTIMVKPGLVLDFLLENQNVSEPSRIDWVKAKKVLKSLRIKTLHSNQEFKITGLSDYPCNSQMFSMKQRGGPTGDGEDTMVELSVSDYYEKTVKIRLRESRHLPCINVGKPKRPVYFPLELCELVSLQRYTRALSSLQRASLCDKSRQKPHERSTLLENTIKTSNYNADPILRASGILIHPPQLSEVEGRVLPAPQLVVGNGDKLIPRRGRWNFNSKKFAKPVTINEWAAVNFSARCDTRSLCDALIRCGKLKGVLISPPMMTIDERPQDRRAPAAVRVDRMFEALGISGKRPNNKPEFLLCVLPEKKNSDIYGPWKRKCLAIDSDIGKNGIVTQCLAPAKHNDQYLTNLLLKINVKLGGSNSYLNAEQIGRIPLVSKIPTLILGMDVSHGPPGRSDAPSIAAVVSSREWPLVSKYRARVRAQSSRVEMIEKLYDPTSNNGDHGCIRDILLDFYNTSGQKKPKHIIVFRDGVGDSQFNQVLNTEFDQIVKACERLQEGYRPRFTFVVAQKNHHTRFFQKREVTENVPPGTVVDSKVCHPKHNDFYMCAHAGLIGTTRPTHYHVLIDEIGFTADELQELVHSLSYVYQRSTTAVSQVAPICYAHHAAAQLSQFVKFDEWSDGLSVQGRAALSREGVVPVTQLPCLQKNVCNSMFFC